MILSGDKYGWIPLPRVIEKNEFEKIQEKLEKLKQDISILKKWYRLDENQLLPSYILKAKDIENDKDYTIWENWEQVENKETVLNSVSVW